MNTFYFLALRFHFETSKLFINITPKLNIVYIITPLFTKSNFFLTIRVYFSWYNNQKIYTKNKPTQSLISISPSKSVLLTIAPQSSNLSITSSLGCPKVLYLPTETIANFGFTKLINSETDEVFEPVMRHF